MPVQRTVWRIPRAGSLARLARVKESLPDPAPGQARLRVEAIGLNFADILACLGLYSATPSGPFIPGLECAGTIEAVGPGTRLVAGDRVCVLTRFGAYADRLNFDQDYAIPLPAGWSAAEAAAWPVQGMTAWYGLVERARVAAGDTVLVQSAAGGVGLQALGILESVGARVIATIGREDKRRFLETHYGLSPESIIVREPGRFQAQLDQALAAVGATGLDVVFDAVLGPYFRPAFGKLNPEGRFVLFGAADFMPAGRRPNYPSLLWQYLRRPRLDPLAMISANQSFIGFNLIWLWDEVGRMPAAIEGLIRHAGGRKPYVGQRLSFDRAPEAMQLLQSGSTVGKVILEVQEGDIPKKGTVPLSRA
jgi:NADPH:quinone reductase-like Zn-dependent oxidoreductase